MLSASCARHLPPRVEPPASGPAEIGVAYGMSVSCPRTFELGDMWWSFDEPLPPWPPDISIPPFPFSLWATNGYPYQVPGIVTLSSPTKAIYRADVDGTEFRLTGRADNPSPGDACL